MYLPLLYLPLLAHQLEHSISGGILSLTCAYSFSDLYICPPLRTTIIINPQGIRPTPTVFPQKHLLQSL